MMQSEQAQAGRTTGTRIGPSSSYLSATDASESEFSALEEYSEVSLYEEDATEGCTDSFTDGGIWAPGEVAPLQSSVQFTVQLLSDVKTFTVTVTVKGVSNLSCKYEQCVTMYQVS